MSVPDQLTPHFSLSEFLRNEVLPDDAILLNIHFLAQRLQVIRDLLNRPIQITSGYRSPRHNAAVGGASNSYHLRGMAADVVVPGMPARALQTFLKHWSGGMGSYEHFTHLDIRAERTRWQ